MNIKSNIIPNSSNQGFTAIINIYMKDFNLISWNGFASYREENDEYYEMFIKRSPKELASAKDISNLIELLNTAVLVVINENEEYIPIGDELSDRLSNYEIKNIDRIQIIGNEDGYEFYHRSYTFELGSGKYYGKERSFEYEPGYDEYDVTECEEEFEKSEDSGGHVLFNLSGCNIDYQFGYDDDEDYDDYSEFEDAQEPKGSRIVAYFKKGNDNELKFFRIKYANPVLEDILNSFDYSSNKIEPFNIQYLEDIIPGYSGVKTLQELTHTLISALVTFGTGKVGLEETLEKEFNSIVNGFVSIEGTSQETFDKTKCNFDGEADGYDFSLNDGNYVAKYRKCVGGW